VCNNLVMCAMIHMYVCHNLFMKDIRVQWLSHLHMCAMT